MEYIAHEVAKMLGVSVPTLHYYEKAGLLPPIKRNQSGNRVYSKVHIEWLQMIILMREADIPIRDIREYVTLLLAGSQTIPDRYELVKKYKESVEDKVKAMQLSLLWLNAKVDFYQETIGRGTFYQTFSEESHMFRRRFGLDNENFADNLTNIKEKFNLAEAKPFHIEYKLNTNE